MLIELEYFRCHDFPYEDADMTIKAVSSLNSKFNFRRKIIVEDGLRRHSRLRYTEHFGQFGAQFEINITASKIEIIINRIVSNSNHVLYVNLVEPILRLLFISKGYMLLHSACINNNSVDKGILISAPPDTGKTSTVLECMKNGFSYLSDDMTILRLPNEAICFPKPMTISSHTYKTVATVSKGKNNEIGVKRNNLKLRSMIHSKKGRAILRKLGDLNVPIFTINAIAQILIKPPKFNVDDILQDVFIKERTKIYDLAFLEIGVGDGQSINSDIAALKAIENSDDAFLSPPYKEISEYLTIDGKSVNDLLEIENHRLKEFLANISCTVMKSNNRTWHKNLPGAASNNLQPSLVDAVSISIVIPVHNEERRIVECLEKTLAYCDSKNWDFEIIVVDDGSNDKTVKMVDTFHAHDGRIRLLSLPYRVGKGGSIAIAGLSGILKNLFAYFDVDLSAEPSELQRLIENIDNYDIAIGSRMLRGKSGPVKRPIYRTILSYLYSKAFRVLFRIPIYDPQCGLKLFQGKVIPRLFSEVDISGFAFDSDVIVKACSLGLRIKEIPIKWTHGETSTLSVLTAIKSMGIDLLSIWYRCHLLWQEGKPTYPQKKGSVFGKGLFAALSLIGQIKRTEIYSDYKSLISNIPVMKRPAEDHQAGFST